MDLKEDMRMYVNERDALIEVERKHRHDSHWIDKLSSQIVFDACDIVSHIRQREMQTLWTKLSDASADEMLYPGMPFNMAKSRIESTDMWKIIRRMPKGSLLHAHLEAMFDVDFLVEQCLATAGMHISADRPILSSGDYEQAPFTFRYCTDAQEETQSIWASGYESGSLVPIQVAATSFPNGGMGGFRHWVASRCVLNLQHTYASHQGQAAIWDVFKRAFPIIISMGFYEPIFRRGLARILAELAQDEIQYVEFRVGSGIPFQRNACNLRDNDHLYFLHVFEEELQTFQKTIPGKRFYGARIIYTAPRRLSDDAIMDRMERCIQAKLLFPELICGFDLVGNEELGRPLVDLVHVLMRFRQRCGENGVELPLFLHAGECLGDGDETDNNLYDAILLGSRRIGHGFSLYKHPVLIDLVKEKNILIECCPISNEVLRLTNGIRMHPLPALLARGVATTLCNDDPAILGHGRNGLAYEYWQALQGFANLGLKGLANMARNSVLWSCYTDQNEALWQSDLQNQQRPGSSPKAGRLRAWDNDFVAFCAWVVQNFRDEKVM